MKRLLLLLVATLAAWLAAGSIPTLANAPATVVAAGTTASSHVYDSPGLWPLALQELPTDAVLIASNEATSAAGDEVASTPIQQPRVAAEDVASTTASRATQLQEALPAGSQGRVTMGVGVGRDAEGGVRTVVGTSEPNGYLRPGVSLNPGEELATGAGHAEASIIDYMGANGIEPLTIAAGRPICPACASLLDEFGIWPASPLKVP